MSQGLSGLPSLVPSTTKVLYLPTAPGHREMRWPQSNNSQYQPYFIHSIVTVLRLLQLQWSSSSPPQPACSIHSSHNLWLFHLHMYTSETTGRMEGNRRPSLPTDLIETPHFSVAVSVKFSSEEILLWVWTGWVTHSTPELYQASIWSKISAQFRELLLPVIHISHLLRKWVFGGKCKQE